MIIKISTITLFCKKNSFLIGSNYPEIISFFDFNAIEIVKWGIP